MVCFETKEEVNIAIENLNETTRYITKECEPKKQRININGQDKTHTITAKEKEQKRSLLNTVTTEHIAQTTQSTNKSELNKEKRGNNITSNKNGQSKNNSREQERVFTDQLCHGCGSNEHKIQKYNKKSNVFATNNERRKTKEEEMRRIMEKYGMFKSIKLRFHPNNTKNETMICFSTEE